MRFMMLMIPKGYEKAEPGAMPDPKAVEAMMKYNEELGDAGILLALDGLKPPSEGARVTFSGGKRTVAQGPFPNTTEALGGYWMIDVKSKDEAVAWATRCPVSDDAVIEIREVQELKDFPEEIRKLAANFTRMRSEAGRKPINP